jgi:hypothetical protein
VQHIAEWISWKPQGIRRVSVTEEQVFKVQEEDAGPEAVPEAAPEAQSAAQARPRFDDTSLVIGIILIAVGGLLLAGRVLNFDIFGFLRHLFWPFYIIVPGILLCVLSLVVRGNGEGLDVVGSIATAVGLVLFYQNITGHWSSWSYAWALVAPTSFGVGLTVYGAIKGKQKKVKEGLEAAKVGGILFLVGLVFFELVIGISGFGLGRIGWPILLIGLGAVVLVRALVRRD